MHSFLRAIGFSGLHDNIELGKLLDEIIDSPDYTQLCKDSYGNEYVELTKEYGQGFGVRVCGQFLDADHFEVDYYYPYFIGDGITTREKIELERRAGNESYAGIVDEIKLGVALIFHIQNPADYLIEVAKNPNCLNQANVTLAGLSIDGRIILPIAKAKETKEEKNNRQSHNHLMAAAREGDEEAIESLTIEELDTYSMISRRIEKEDVLSIVETSFMPYGVESDQFAIIGEIEACGSVMNRETKEELYILTVNTCDVIFDICIQKNDLLGEPMVGRRFKGSVWLQGRLNFEE